MAELQTLMDRLGYQFRDHALLVEALSHRSSGSHNYERLEFLGDGFLNFVVATELFHLRSDDNEGDLSRLRASLVRESTLAEIARELSLGDYLNMGVGELRSGGFKRDSILSDVVESIVGAVFIESGYDSARELVLRLYKQRIASLPASAELKDPKTRLQELLQGRGLERPDYVVVDTRGKDHERQFTVKATLDEPAICLNATASSRRKAEQTAAALVLTELEQLL